MAACPSCSASAPDGSRFCPSCGRRLDTDDRTRLSGTDTRLVTDDTRTMASPRPGQGLDVSRRVATELSLEPGTTIGHRYRVVRAVGRGGMGVVYLADDLRLKHQVALKFLPPALAADPHRLAQFHNEVSLSRQISHPNVCRVYDIGDVDGQLFLSMEYVDGHDLATVLRERGRWPENDAVDLIREICAGLAAVHGSGVTHRDLKPANILITRDGTPKLSDFGIATTDGDAASIEGTPAYMAPEQLGGSGVSPQSDIYALGLIIHEIISGSRVFSARTLDELRAAQHAPETTLPVDASVSARLRDLVLACLAIDPARRPASAQAVGARLQTVLLDTSTVWRRLFQIALQVVVVLLLVTVWVMGLGREHRLTALTFIALAAALTYVALRTAPAWTVRYKGHRIRWYNHPVFGERLYIDDVLADRGRIALAVTIRGTIESGAGAGERITASSRCTFVRISCRIVAEAFAPDSGTS